MKQVKRKPSNLINAISASLVAAVIAAAWPTAWVATVCAEEPAAGFMEALRLNQHYEIALEYLDSVADSPLVTVEFKEQLEYQRGMTLMEQSRAERDSAKRDIQLDRAGEAFTKFVNMHPDHPMADDCNQQLGNLLVERGRSKLARAEKAANKAPLQKEAREFFDEAYRVFAKAENDIREKLSMIPKILDPKQDSDLIEQRDRLRQNYLQALLLSAAILEETADALDANDAERKELLTKASGEYAKIYEDYRTRIAGSYALLYQGRCDQKLGKHKDALSFFTELMDQPDDPSEFRKLKVRAINLAMPSWVAEDKLAVAVSKSIELLKTERPNESQDMAWLELKMHMGRAAKDYVKQLTSENSKDPKIKLIRVDARKLLVPATKMKSDYQDEARRLVAEFQGADPDAVEQVRAAPKTFAEAKDAGKEVLDSIGTAQLILKTVPGRIEKETDPANKAALEAQLKAAEDNLANGYTQAKEHFQLALEMVTPETPAEEVNIVRYFLCFLYYMDKQFLESALVGEFVAMHAPRSAGARPSAKIALASHINLYRDNTSGDRSFETQRIKEVADYIIEKWPEQPEAEEAINTVIPFLIQDNKLELAMEYVERIPESSPRRGEVELKVGQALWSTYMTAVQTARAEAEAAGVAAPPPAPEVVKKKEDAKAVLSAGIQRMEASGVSEQLVVAALSLAQISVESGDAAGAVKVLEHPTYGLVKLGRDGHAATQNPGVAEEIYKTALRAYISSLASGGDRAQAITKAKDMMAALKGSSENPKKLVGTYVSLAQSLQKQIDLAEPAERKVLSDGMATFLKEVGAEGTEFSVLNWVATTFDVLGESNMDRGRLTEASKSYFAEAGKTRQKLLDNADKPGFLPSENKAAMVAHLRMKLATTLISTGDFLTAKTQLLGLLKENEMNVSAQVAAASMYQKWGAYPDMASRYKDAMLGTERVNNKNLIWGWGKLAKLTAGKKQFADVFHNARIQLAMSRMGYALAQKDVAEKNDLLKKAEQDIVLTYKLYPDLGGDKWRGAYDKSLKAIQAASAKPATGLAGLKAPATAPKK